MPLETASGRNDEIFLFYLKKEIIFISPNRLLQKPVFLIHFYIFGFMGENAYKFNVFINTALKNVFSDTHPH